MRGPIGLAFDQAPSLQVPLRFLLTAPLWGVVAGVLLFYLGPSALLSRWTPGALALTHAITLGVMAQVMLGALWQLLPVLAGARVVAAKPLSLFVHVLLNLGLAALLGGFLGLAWAFPWAFALLATGFALWLASSTLALLRTAAQYPSVTAMRLAVLALAMTVGFGLYLLAGHMQGAVDRDSTVLHIGWGLAGWVTLLVIGVAYQVVPMFQLTPEYPRWLRRPLPWVVFTLLVLWSATQALALSGLARITAGLLFATLAVFAGTTLWLQSRRRRAIADATLFDWRLGIGCGLAAALLLIVGDLWPAFAARDDVAVVIAVLLLPGCAVALILGMLYKIVPFLLWLDLNKRMTDLATRRRLPSMKAFISDRAARWQSRLYWLGVGMLLAAVALPDWMRPAALALTAAFAWLFVNLARAVWLYRTIRAELSEPA